MLLVNGITANETIQVRISLVFNFLIATLLIGYVNSAEIKLRLLETSPAVTLKTYVWENVRKLPKGIFERNLFW